MQGPVMGTVYAGAWDEGAPPQCAPESWAACPLSQRSALQSWALHTLHRLPLGTHAMHASPSQ